MSSGRKAGCSTAGGRRFSPGGSKAKTARKRKANGKPGKARKAKPVLVDTGTLKKSFFVSPSGNGATVGTPVKYAVFHQFGAPAAIPSPGDVITALQNRSDMETVIAEWGRRRHAPPEAGHEAPARKTGR